MNDPIERVIKLLEDEEQVWDVRPVTLEHESGLQIWGDSSPHIYSPVTLYPTFWQKRRFKKAIKKCEKIHGDNAYTQLNKFLDGIK